MPSEFVPFLKSSGATNSTASQKLAAHSAPLSRDNPNVTAAFSALVPGHSPAHAATPTACAKSPANSKPVVTLKRDGDQVTHIHIQCGCGEVIELECA